MRLKNTKRIFNKAGVWCRDHFSEAWKKVKAHGPEIKIATGVVLMGGAVISSSFRGARANERIKAKKKEAGTEALSKTDLLKTAGPHFVKTGILYGAGVVCVGSGARDIFKKHSELVGAYSIALSNLGTITNRVKEQFGEEKLQEITSKTPEKITDSSSKLAMDGPTTVIFPRGKHLCKESVTGKFFYSNKAIIERNIANLNIHLRDSDNLSYVEFYLANNISDDGTSIRENLGWNINNGMIGVYFTTDYTTEFDPGFQEGVPYLKVNFYDNPRYSEVGDWYHIDY